MSTLYTTDVTNVSVQTVTPAATKQGYIKHAVLLNTNMIEIDF